MQLKLIALQDIIFDILGIVDALCYLVLVLPVLRKELTDPPIGVADIALPSRPLI